ncbi:MAG: hypothetical protein JSV56_12435, partial [Methanomassiliicoccales archaeon]
MDTQESDLITTITSTVQIDPGDMFYIYFDPEDLELVEKPPIDLPEECDQALAAVPKWLRGNLSNKFRQLDSDFQITYANLILDSPDDIYIDEIAFVIAHSAVENLQDEYFFPELITHNAQLIYANDQYLNYVDVVERDNYTTVIYKDKDNESMELPKDIYYWYIVHPKLSDELPTYVDPDHNYTSDPPINEKNYGVPPPTGKFWRDWLFYLNDSGYPLLREKLQGAYTLWEAISACNSWIGGSMRFTSDNERPIQPVRIYRKHYGRCGEYQDMRNAAARAGLIPSTCAHNVAEDHVWNEFWDQRWIHWDGGVDNPMMYENGWGKKISSVWNSRGDSSIWSVTNKYTKTCNFTATVLDDSGMPVDGALVNMLTENYYFPDDLLSLTTWGTTDYTGTVTIPLGDQRNFWSNAESDDLGSDPSYGSEQVITNSSVDENYAYTFNLPLSAPALKVSEITPPGNIDEHFRMEISYEVMANILRVENSYTNEHGDLYGPSGNIDFFIADILNYNLYANDLSFNAYEVNERSISGDVSFVLPDESRHYAVMSNEFSQETTKIVKITVNIHSRIKVDITSPADNSQFDHGAAITISGTAWGPWGVDNVEIDIDNLDDWAPATDTSGSGDDPYSSWEFTLDTNSIEPGVHAIMARAKRDENTSVMWINITLNDVTDPDLVVESPAEGSIYWLGEIMTVSGTVTDNGEIDVLELIIDSDEDNKIDLIPFLSADFWTYDLNVNDLGYGDHTINVWTSDSALNYASVTRNIRVHEAIDPNVWISSPSEGQIFKPGDTVYISGIATDNQEILSLEIYIDDDEPIDIISQLNEYGLWEYDWETDSSFSEGEHIIQVNATDGSGNEASDTTTVVFDGTIPGLIIDNPLQDSKHWVGETIIVNGTATDNTGIHSLELIIDSDEANRTDITSYLIDDFWMYEISENELDYGQHTITVRANDLASNSVSITRNIAVLESVEPEVKIESPKTGLILKRGDKISISGLAQDNIEISYLEIVIDNKAPINITSSLKEDGSWVYEWDTRSVTTQYEHTITVKATDGSGNIGTDEIEVIVDGKAPEAMFILPEEHQIFKAGDPIVLQGMASDDWDIDKVLLELEDASKVDITSKLAEDHWEYKFWDTRSLESGPHTFTLYVTDSVGQKTESTITIYIDSEEP